MPIYIGDKEIATVFKGDKEVTEIFQGTNQAFVSATEAPTLTFVSRTQTTMTLSVTNNDSDPITDIEISYAGGTFTQGSLSIASEASQNFTITGLAMNTSFNFIAIADADGKGFSEDSNTVTQSTLAQQTPGIQSVSALNSTTIRFRLKNNNAETTTVRYRISGSDPTTSSAGVSLGAGALSGNIDVGGQPDNSTRTIKAATFINNIKSGVAQATVTTPMNVGPGPTSVIAGNMTTGFFGEVTQTTFGKTMTSVMSDLGISQGTAQNTSEPLLKFIHNGKIKYINKKSIRNSISWDYIASKINVYGGTTMTFGGNSYKVRLMRGYGQVSGSTSSVTTPDYVNGPLYTVNYSLGVNWPNDNSDWSANNPNEWNTLMFPISSSSQSQTGGVPNWASFSNNDLNIGTGLHQGGDGKATWTQETLNTSTGNRLRRGSTGLEDIRIRGSSDSNIVLGLRLVFELI